MNKSIIICESVKAYFSSHASLAAIGRKFKKLKEFEPVEQKVKIAQKTVKYSPLEKLLDAFITLLSGAHGTERARQSTKCATSDQGFVLAASDHLFRIWQPLPALVHETGDREPG